MDDKKKEELNVDLAWQTFDNLNIGEKYPLYGILTNVKKKEDVLEVEINYYLPLKLRENFGDGKILVAKSLQDQVNISQPMLQFFQERLYEKGIFYCELESKDPLVFICHSVIFGKPDQPVQ